MRRARTGLALAVVAVAAPAAATALPPAARRCAPVSVQYTSTASRWTYTVEATGGVGCAVARGVVAAMATKPEPPRGWSCRVGTSARSWALSCVEGGQRVRAFGPTLSPGSWTGVARRLTMPVLEPSLTAGLAFQGIVAGRACAAPGKIGEWLLADYGRPGESTLRVAEGRPAPCGNFGVNQQLAVWRVHGRPARLFEFCSPPGCARLTGSYLLTWSEHGVQVGLMTSGIDETTLLGIARSLSPVAPSS